MTRTTDMLKEIDRQQRQRLLNGLPLNPEMISTTRGVLPHMRYTGMCRPIGYGFGALAVWVRHICERSAIGYLIWHGLGDLIVWDIDRQ